MSGHLSIELAVLKRWALCDQGRKVVVTNGCFDLLHAQHVLSLHQAAAAGDSLFVLVNSDESVQRLKGATRPIMDLESRCFVLGALRHVDQIVVFHGDHCGAELEVLCPNVYAKCEEYRDCQHPAEKAALEECGAEVLWLPRNPGDSTTALIKRIAAAARAESADSARLPANHTEVPKTDPNWGLA